MWSESLTTHKCKKMREVALFLLLRATSTWMGVSANANGGHGMVRDYADGVSHAAQPNNAQVMMKGRTDR